jgi:hypothetical protein
LVIPEKIGGVPVAYAIGFTLITLKVLIGRVRLDIEVALPGLLWGERSLVNSAVREVGFNDC